MKRITLLCLFATFTATTIGFAQAPTPIRTTPTGNSATDDVVNQMGGIRRPIPAPVAAGEAKASGPKKPLEATLSTDDKGKSPTTTFAASTAKIYLHYQDDSAAKGEKLRAVWIAEDAAGFSTKNKKLNENSTILPGPGAYGSFFLPSSNGAFPVGKYRAELYDGDKLAKSLKFTVTK